jgi:imidazolonepropionase-like amidohydrolase
MLIRVISVFLESRANPVIVNQILLMIVGAAVLAASCADGETTLEPQELPGDVIRAPAAIAITDVTVLPMTTEQRLEHQTVVVRAGRIESITPTGKVPFLAEAVVDGRGRVLMPALIDMHVHLKRADLPAYLRAGIATVRNMWGHDAILAMKRDIEAGTLDGPAIYSTSNGFDGNPPQWPYTRLVLDAREADGAVAEAVAQGWIAIKVYQQLPAESYDSIVASARRRGIPFMGHVPSAVTVEHALASGQRSIEHLSGYDAAVSRRGATFTLGWSDVDANRFAALVQKTVQAGTWNCPTMAIIAALGQQHPPAERQAIVRNRRDFLRELVRQHARVLVGTDAGIDVVAPGTSIYDELNEFVASGMTPYQSLRAATIDAAEFLGVPGLGTVRVGAPASLLLLDANPLQDIDNIRRVAGVLVRGTWFPAAALPR